jgi:hypothetical protein
MAIPEVLCCSAEALLARAPHRVLTLPIIGSRSLKWNVFSILIRHEIFIATPLKMT